jgi:cellulose synthase operon protein C
MPPTAHHHAASAPLQGEALLSFLDQSLEQLFSEHRSARISHTDREHALAELLSQQQFTPQTLSELVQLHSAWMYAGQPAMAVQTLAQHSNTVTHSLQGPALWHAQASIALHRAQSLLSEDATAAQQALADALPPMRQLDAETLAPLYPHWMSLAQSCEAHTLAEQAIDWLTPLLTHDAQSFTDRVQPWLDKTRLAQARADDAAVLSHAHAAITQMAQLQHDDAHPDFDTWAQLGDMLLPVCPASVTQWASTSQAHLQRTEATAPSPAVRQHRAIYTARLQALACAQLGQLDQAIAWGRLGRYELSGYEGDDFVATWMEWLYAQDLLDELAPIALESVFHSRPASLQVGWKVAQECIERDTPHRATWARILAWCCMDRECRERVPAPPHPAQHYLEIVQAESPDDGIVMLMKGLELARSRKQWDKALPLLEQACAQHPQLCNSEVVLMLWAARFHIHGEAALQMPIPAAPSGHWSYGLGVALDDDDDMKPYMGGKKNLPAHALRQALVQHYYEQGLAHFEQFWQTGQGGFKDADIHIYSMLCNNLAIKLRHNEDYARAADLHQRGLASSPFAEHLHGLLWCSIMPDDYVGIARTAESLWHFAREHGYGRHNPYLYFNWVAEALFHLDRSAEISIWLERLELWWQEEADEDDAEERHQYLECLLIMLDFFATGHAALVAPRLPALVQEVRPLRLIVLQRRLGRVLMDCGQHAEALPLLQTAVELASSCDDSFEVGIAPKDLQRCEEALAEATLASPRKPWWKLW